MTRAGARVWTVAAACFGAMVACTTRVVDFAAHDGGANPDSSVTPVADAPPSVTPVPDASVTPVPDAPPAEVPGEVPPPAVSSVAPREITGSSDAGFWGVPSVDGPSLYVEYKCCNEAGSSCSVWIQGDDVACRDTATWSLSAAHDCESRGFVVVVASIGLYVGC